MKPLKNLILLTLATFMSLNLYASEQPGVGHHYEFIGDPGYVIYGDNIRTFDGFPGWSSSVNSNWVDTTHEFTFPSTGKYIVFYSALSFTSGSRPDQTRVRIVAENQSSHEIALTGKQAGGQNQGQVTMVTHFNINSIGSEARIQARCWTGTANIQLYNPYVMLIKIGEADPS